MTSQKTAAKEKGEVTLQGKNYITKWLPYFGLLCKWRRSNSGDCQLHDFKHAGLAKITNSSIVQQFLLAQSVSYALVTNQIACYIIGPIESAVAHLGVVLKANLIGPWRI